MPQYQYNGVRINATKRRSSPQKNKAWARTVTHDGKKRTVHYADPDMPMRRNNPEARKNFLSRHNCAAKRDPFTPGFWACYDWQNVDEESEVIMSKDNLNEQRDTARRPSFEGTETISWGDVAKTFEAYRDGVCSGVAGEDPPATIGDASQELKTCIASKSLLGDAQAETFDEVLFFPVVNPETNRLNRGALNAVLSGRGAAADISAGALESAQEMARGLRDSEFSDGTEETETQEADYAAMVMHFNTALEHLAALGDMLAMMQGEPESDRDEPMDAAGDTESMHGDESVSE